jgi:hypothetical protein
MALIGLEGFGAWVRGVEDADQPVGAACEEVLGL